MKPPRGAKKNALQNVHAIFLIEVVMDDSPSPGEWNSSPLFQHVILSAHRRRDERIVVNAFRAWRLQTTHHRTTLLHADGGSQTAALSPVPAAASSVCSHAFCEGYDFDGEMHIAVTMDDGGATSGVQRSDQQLLRCVETLTTPGTCTRLLCRRCIQPTIVHFK